MLTVREAMTGSVVAVRADMPLKDVARLLVQHRISGLPVVDDAGAVLGVVSEADFLMKEQGADAIPHRPLARLRGESRAARSQLAKVEAVTAGEAMTAPAVTIEPGQRISEAAAIMTARGLNRLPVVEDGCLVGIVTRADLVRAYVRSDDELAQTIREDVLLRMLWLDPVLFDVKVKDGMVSISGRVERRSTAEMVEHAVRLVPGVVEVAADIEWSVDDRHLEPVTIDAIFPFSPK
jgi:CBS domain-containing protein